MSFYAMVTKYFFSKIFLLFFLLSLNTFGQDITISNSKINADEEYSELKSIIGFNSFCFKIRTGKAYFLNAYVEEFLNDTLISKKELKSDKGQYPPELLDKIFPKTSKKNSTIRVYSHAKNDTTEKVYFRFGGMEIIFNLRIDRPNFEYEWKEAIITETRNNTNVGKDLPLLYFSTAVEETVNGQTINRFCGVPNILANKKLISGSTKISHYFIVGVQILDKL